MSAVRRVLLPSLGLATAIAIAIAIAIATATAIAAQGADPARVAEVARRGADVMPFDLKSTVHVFTPLDGGGVQRVVTRRQGDEAQARLVRRHLKELRERFLRGDFSGPQQIHGADMPGLARLRQARPGQIGIYYREVPGGAELSYRTQEPPLVAALHDWFQAQLWDHGPDAVAGSASAPVRDHAHVHDHGPQPGR